MKIHQSVSSYLACSSHCLAFCPFDVVQKMFLSSFLGSGSDGALLMTGAGSIYNHPEWLGLWPLAEPDNSELSDFYPPINSVTERERERQIGPHQIGRGSRSEKQGVEERMRREMKGKRVWRHRWRGEGHSVLLTLEALTLSQRDRHQGKGRWWKEREEDKSGIKRSEM